MTVQIDVNTVDISRLANLIAAAGDKAPLAIGRALNRAGDQARTKMRRTLAKQTGLKYRVISKALGTQRAFRGASKGGLGGSNQYVIYSRGGDIALKYFSARETRKGVTAAPFGKRRVFPGTFMKGGRFPNRKDLGRGGHVFRRTGAARFPIEKQKSGVIIPEEMLKGETRDAFYSIVEAELPDRLAHELYGVLGIR